MLKARSFCRLKQWVRQKGPLFITTAGITSTIIILRLLGILQASEFAALDQLFRLRPVEPIDKRILIVEINENDLQQIRQWPIPDQVIAQLLQKLNAYQPHAIGLDLYRNFPVEPGYANFVKAGETIPNLIGIEKLEDKTTLGVPPPPVLNQRQQVGFNNVIVDVDGRVRRSLLYWHIEGKLHTSFALQLALLYLQQKGITPKAAANHPEYLQLGQDVFRSFESNDGGYVRADDQGYQILANFRRNEGFRTVSLLDVLAGRVPAEWVRSNIVLIGSTAPSLKDFFYIPLGSNLVGEAQTIAGVELHAHFVSQILSTALNGRPLIKVWPEPIEWLWIFCWSGLGAVFIRKARSPGYAFLGLMLAGGAIVGVCYFVFWLGWWLPLVPGLLGLFGAAAVSMGYLAYQREELKRSKEFLQTIINTIPDPVFVKDKNHRWIILNQAYCQLIGYPLEKLRQMSDYDIFPRHQADALWTQDEIIFNTGAFHEIETEFTDAFGNTHLIATKKSLHKDAGGNLFLVGVIRDITERKRTEEELRRSNTELRLSEDRLRYLAYHDALTGLANRKQFYERLNQSLDWASTHNQLIALMFLDLDGFKQVNDTLGHDTGDQLLQVVAKRLTNSLRSTDIVARLGGDEFTVILPGIPQADYAAKVAQKILDALSQVFVLEGRNVYVTVSIGISIFPLDGEDEETLIKNADTAMYRAKQLGRNQHQFAHFL